LKEVNACYNEFAYPIKLTDGEIKSDGNIISFSDLKATLMSGELGEEKSNGVVLINGQLIDSEFSSLLIEGSRQRITNKLKQTLKSILPENALFLTDLDCKGAADFKYRMKKDGAIENLDLKLHIDSLAGDRLPVKLEDIRGEVVIDLVNGGFLGKEISLRTHDGRFVFSELSASADGDFITLDLMGSGKNICLDKELSELLAIGSKDGDALLEGGGGLDIEDLDLHIEFDNEEIRTFESDMKIRFNGDDLCSVVDINNIHGDLTLKIEPADDGSYAVKGETKGMSFALEDRLFTDVEAGFGINNESFILDYFQSSFFEGKLKGVGETPLCVGLAPPRHFKGQMVVDNAPLKYFFDHRNYAVRNLSGRVDGSINFEGELDNPHRTLAEGDILVKEGMLFELPIFGDLSRLMGNIFSTEPPTFTGGSAKISLMEGIINLAEISIDSTLIRLNGDGKMTPDGIDLKLIPSTNIMPKIPIIGHIVDILKDGLLTFKIAGPYSNIEVSYETIVDKIFKDDKVPDEPRYMGRIEYKFTERF